MLYSSHRPAGMSVERFVALCIRVGIELNATCPEVLQEMAS